MQTTAIDLRRVTVRRGDNTILRNITWNVPAGSSAAILGPNGSGKSTLARILLGQMWPTSGEVTVLGQTFGDTDLNALRESIRLVQSNGTVDIDPAETALNIALTGYFGTVGLYQPVSAKMTTAARAVLGRVGLKKHIRQPYGTLSNGERMRCLIARALVVKPKLLILDEPTAGLDLLAREQVLATVAAMTEGKTSVPAVLMITHHVEELLPSTSSVLILKDGRSAAIGTPRQVLRDDVLSRVYDFPVQVTRRGGRYWVRAHPHAWKVLVKR